MDATATQLTDIKFNEAKRGYDPVEVDNFLEKLGDAVVKLQDKVREANRRAEDAERRLTEAQRTASAAEKRALDAEAHVAAGGGPGSEDELAETLKKTLLLAQRTADETVKEAKADAARIVADAEKAAARQVEDANRSAAQRLAEVEDEIASRRAAETGELQQQVKALEDVRVKLVADVEALEAHLGSVRDRIRAGADLLVEVLEHPERLRAPGRPTLQAPPVETVTPAPSGAASEGAEDPAPEADGPARAGSPGARDGGGATAEAGSPGAPDAAGPGVTPIVPGSGSAGSADAPAPAPAEDGAADPTDRLFPPTGEPAAAPAPALAGDEPPAPAPRPGADPAGRRGGPPASSGAGRLTARSATRRPEPAGPPAADADGPGPSSAPPRIAVIQREPVARDDNFLDELRKASDDDPLGPVDAEADAAMQAFFADDDEDLPRRPRFGRRR